MLLPSLTVGTPFYNSSWVLEEYFKGLVDLDYPKDKITLVFTDNGSTDNTYDRLVEFKNKYSEVYNQIIIIEVDRVKDKNKRLEFKKNIEKVFNTLVDNMDLKGDLVIIGSDCIPPKDGIHRLLKMRELGGDICGGLTVVAAGRQGNIFLAPHYCCYVWNKKSSRFNSIPVVATKNPRFLKIVPRYQKKIIRCHGIGTGFSIINKEVFKYVRFKADMKYGEDLLFSLEAGLAGYKVLCDTSLFYDHLHYDYTRKEDKDGFYILYRGSRRGEKTYIKRGQRFRV